MPQLYCSIPAGVPREKKQEMLREIVKVTHDAIGSDPKIINVVIYEIERADWAINGEV